VSCLVCAVLSILMASVLAAVPKDWLAGRTVERYTVRVLSRILAFAGILLLV
jgi:hypothetical protein